MNILMTGISGRFGRRLASRLSRKHHVIGVDPRKCPALPKRIEHHHHDIRHRPVENLFRRKNIDAKEVDFRVGRASGRAWLALDDSLLKNIPIIVGTVTIANNSNDFCKILISILSLIKKL